LKKLDDEIKKIVKPLALQLKEENETLIETEFIRAMEDLYELSNYNDKRILIEFYKKIKNKSSNKLIFEKNHSLNGIKHEEKKYFDSHLNLKFLDIVDKSSGNSRMGDCINVEKKKLNNHNKSIEKITFKEKNNLKNLNNSFSFKVS